mgnify:CR=1 FL=1
MMSRVSGKHYGLGGIYKRHMKIVHSVMNVAHGNLSYEDLSSGSRGVTGS